jgi:hypothetical protein
MPIRPEHTTYTVLDFLKWQRDGTLDLRPPFQRNAVWRPALKSSFIDSLLRGYPVPALFIQDRSDASTFERRLIVVDGQQRLRTALSYVDIDCLSDADERDEFSLLAIHDPERAGAIYQELSPEDQAVILEARLTAYLVDSSVSEAELLEIFRRMNTYSAKLNAQELRNANYSGEFKQLAYRLASELYDQWTEWGTLNKQQIAEMRDVEFTSILMLLALNGVGTTSAADLNRAYDEYEEVFPLATRCSERVLEVMHTIDEIFWDQEDSVRRLTTRMWIYSLFDAVQHVRFGGPLLGRTKNSRRVSLARLRRAAVAVNSSIENDELPDKVARATRGAANDRQSREARAAFFLKAIEASS